MLQPSILRILIDLIKADAVIDSTEMEDFRKIQSEYKINNSHLKKASETTLAEAVSELQDASYCQQDRNDLLKKLKNMTVVDGFCVKKEALILTAMYYCLSRGTKANSEIISINTPNISIAEDQIVYIESESNRSIHKDIWENYRMLNTEFKCAGLNFFYLPKVAEHYNNTDPGLFKDVCSFLAPGYDEEDIDKMISYIKEVTTSKFCKDQLFGKLGMSSIYNTKPGLLAHIGTSFVDNKLYNNFMKITFDESDDIKRQILAFLDMYTRYLSYDVVVIPKTDDTEGHFLYGGFYKFIYDLYLVKNKVDSTILIENLRTGIFFPQIGRDFELNVTRREKALYIMMILESKTGGICFSPTKDEQGKMKIMERIKARFRFLYTRMGGDYDNVPDITNSVIRNPSIAHINTFFKNSCNIFTDNTKYLIKKKKIGNDSYYYVDFDDEQIYAKTSVENEPVTIFDSEMYLKYKSIK